MAGRLHGVSLERQSGYRNPPVRNSCSILTASRMIFSTVSGCGLLLRWVNNRQAKSVCRPSSREINSLENVRPGMRPRFLSQKIEAKDPEKKMPSTAAKAMRRSANVDRVSVIHLRAH